jgi:uncharacterized protein YggE
MAFLAVGFAIVAGLTSACSGEGDTIVQTQGAATGITVSGTGRVSGAPDIAFLSLGVQVEADSVEAAREAAAQAQTAVLNAVKAAGVAERDVQTINYTISPRYSFGPGAREITGYAVSNTVAIKVRNLESVSKVLDDATRAGGNSTVVQDITFGIDDPEQLRVEAREQAVEQARTRAEQLARNAGVSLGKPISIVEGTFSPIVQETLRAPATGAATDTSTPIQSGELDVVITVQVVYAIE